MESDTTYPFGMDRLDQLIEEGYQEAKARKELELDRLKGNILILFSRGDLVVSQCPMRFDGVDHADYYASKCTDCHGTGLIVRDGDDLL